MSTLLQIFLVVDVFFAGVLVTIGAQQAYAHYRPAKAEPKKPESQPPTPQLTAAAKEKLLKNAEANFETVLDHAATQLQLDMRNTSAGINKLLDQMGTKVVGIELQRYVTELAELRAHAVEDIGGIKAEVAKHETEIKAQISKELEAEKQKLIAQLDTKLADAVGSFLVETLQHNIDLGAQTAYLTSMLEEHKDEFIKEVADEAKPTS